MNKKNIYRSLSFLIPFVVYLITLAPGVTFIDSGELSLASVTLGVAHPTGYPLFTMLGKIFTLIPVGDEVYRLNLMSAFISSASLLIFFNLISFLFELLNEAQKTKTLSEDSLLNLSLASTLILAFTLTYWKASTSIEVYSLHSFFLILNIFLFLKLCFGKEKKITGNYWILFAFVLGLSFTNHLSVIFLAPAFLYLYFAEFGISKNSILRLIFLSIPFAAGLTVYIYLFVRADSGAFNWGNTYNFDNFLRHFTAKEFEGRMFTGSENVKKQFGFLTANLPKEFLYIPVFFVIPGLIMLWQKSKNLLIFFLLLIVTTIFFSVNYNIPDISNYFLPVYISVTVLIGIGFMLILEKLSGKNKSSLSYIFLILPVIILSFNYESANESKDNYVKEYTGNVYKYAPQNSIIISKLWDFLVSPSLYYQNVAGIRPDIIIIDKELLKRSWYLNYLKNKYPVLYDNSKPEFDAFEKEVLSIEANPELKINPRTASDKTKLYKFYPLYKELINSIISSNIDARKIFITPEMLDDENKFFDDSFKYEKLSSGLLTEIRKNMSGEPPDIPEYQFQITTENDYHHKYLMTMYYNAYTSLAYELSKQSRYDEAERILGKAFEIDPVSPEANNVLKEIKNKRSNSK